SCCFAQLAQLCPQAIEYALATRTPRDGFIEWGGGYYYPDHFGSERTNRWELLARHARRTWGWMKKTNTRTIGFNLSRYDSPEALPRYDWIMAHAWSYFKRAPGNDENAEDMPQESAASAGGIRGYSPATWSAERLPASIRVVSPEELVWRIRMQHNASETKQC